MKERDREEREKKEIEGTEEITQKAHGPRFAHLSDSHCRYAGVMQHFF